MSNPCKHDYEHPIRKGRACFLCPICNEDITLELVLMKELEEKDNDGKNGKSTN